MRRRSAVGAALAACTWALAASGSAWATAARPSVATGAAQDVSYASALLAGRVDPKGSDTSYYFQYGPTRAYGQQSAISDAGAGTHVVAVSETIAGLQPITRYHYRLVAVNASGVRVGSDRTFLTSKVPLSLQIVATPNPVLFGGSALVQGTLSGTDNAGREVVLQGQQFPFTAGFQQIGNPELTSPTGTFAFSVLGLTQVTQFRVVTATNPQIVSPVSPEGVTVQVTSHVARTRRAHFARIYGTVTPAENGMQVGILRIEHGRSVPVAGTTLRPLGSGRSSFSRVLHVRRGVYFVFVQVTGGAQLSNNGEPLAIG